MGGTPASEGQMQPPGDFKTPATLQDIQPLIEE